MPQWRDFLERFRPAGAPGSAMPRGVPADRVADTAAELAPLLSLLDEVHAETDLIRSTAVEQADRLRRDGGRQAAAVIDRAQAGRGVLEAESFAQARSRFGAQQGDADAAHALKIEQLRARVAAGMSGYVDCVAAQARTLVAELSEPSMDRADSG